MVDIWFPTEVLALYWLGGLMIPNIPLGLKRVVSKEMEIFTTSICIPVTRSTAVEVDRVGVVNDLLKDESCVLLAGSEGAVASLVARSELARLGDGVVVRAPHEHDGITDGRVHGERNVTENTLRRSDDDGVGDTGA